MNTGENQRIKLTKRLLRLLAKKDIQHITVSELCDGAEINRSTLYNHYVCPVDALAEIECGLCGGALLCQKPGEKTAHHYVSVQRDIPDGPPAAAGGYPKALPERWEN